ncbi:MAG TPA: 3-hydroxyacyl-CoA dehydrogenase family protein [Parafilimonas sp.]|nr:3-hydroxyacyl-CoA dehydrogenase family protein [Parafilimonas sp.]
MNISIRATQQQKNELLQKGFNNIETIHWLTENEKPLDAVDVFFDLTFNNENIAANNFLEGTLVFANAVSCTCAEINKKNYVRIHAWPGFLNRSIIELSSNDENYKQQAKKIFNSLNWQYVFTPDDYGFISARILAMIVNEAYYALQENVSTKEQIDIAMKLGTNYPYGPFEWSEEIGLEKIYLLLKKLSANNNRYAIAGLLSESVK